jgi:DNA-directed RNA polymerase specialized sigma24 family protein
MNEYKAKALEIIAEWEAKDGTERYNFCRNCVFKSIKNGRKLKAGSEIGDATHDTYIKVADQLLDADKLARNIERRANQGFTESLAAIITRAANAILQREIDREKRDSVVISDTATNGSGEEYSLFDTVAGAADTERSAIIRATLGDFYNGLDAKNKVIFSGMVKRLTEREIAPSVGISSIAVHNRMVKIRAQLAAML